MSILYVDTITEKTAGNGVQIPGHVIQVVNSVMTPQAVTTSSTSFVSTGHSLSITPKSSSSIIFLSLAGGGHYVPIDGAFAYVTIYRGATNIGHVTTGLESVYTPYPNTMSIVPHSLSFVDSPSTTSAITYTTYMKTAASTYQYQNLDRSTINFTAMEIAQ